MREKTPSEYCCSNLEMFRTDCVEKSKNILSEFFGCKIIFGICFYEIDERFATGLVIFRGVFI